MRFSFEPADRHEQHYDLVYKVLYFAIMFHCPVIGNTHVVNVFMPSIVPNEQMTGHQIVRYTLAIGAGPAWASPSMKQDRKRNTLTRV
jgi:hypothetical protein